MKPLPSPDAPEPMPRNSPASVEALPPPLVTANEEPPAASDFRLSLRVVAVAASACGLLWLGSWAARHDPTPPPVGPFVAESAPPRSTGSPTAKPETLQPVIIKEPVALPAPKKVTVHVAGRVRKPGVYVLPPLSRINDALAKAGGALPDGDPDALNLADFAQDGEKIEVLPKNAPPETEPVARESEPQHASSPRRAPKPAAPSPKPEREPAPRKTDALSVLRRRPVNLNTADAEQLELLPGIGPAMAERILDHRAERGRFSSVDDLDDVKGIGPKKLEKLRPYVTVR